MNPADLKKDLKSGPTLINFQGREEIFKRRAREIIIDKCIAKDTEDFNLTSISSDNPSSDEVMDLQQEPFDSEYKVVFFHGDDTTDVLKYKGPNTVLVSWKGKLPKPDLTVDCKRLFGNRLKTWLRVNAKSKGLELDKQDLGLIIETFGSDISVLLMQLDKLRLLDVAQGEHVRSLTRDHQTFNVWDLISDIQNKKTGSAVDNLTSLRTSGLSDLQILGALFRQYRLLARQEVGFDLSSEVSEAESFRLGKIKGKFDQDKLIDILCRLTMVEWKIKSGSGSEELTVFIFRLARGL